MTCLSIGLSGKILRMLGMDSSGNVTSVGSAGLSFDVSGDASGKDLQPLAEEITEHITTFTANADLSRIKCGVVIDSSMAFINVIPLDFDETAAAIESHIQWEISNYIPESSRNFSKRFFKLGDPVFEGNIHESLVLAVDRSKVKLIRELLSPSGISPMSIEIAHFAAEKCLSEYFNRSIRDNSVVLSSVFRNRIESSLLQNGTIAFYEYDIPLDRNPVTFLYEQMVKISGKSGNQPVKELFIYGELSEAVIRCDFKQYFEGLKITHLDLFRKGSRESLSGPDSSVYTPLAGLALKNLSA